MAKKKRFRTEIFCLNLPNDSREYEKIMQSVHDNDGKFAIVNENSNWDKVGQHWVRLDYFEFEQRKKRNTP